MSHQLQSVVPETGHMQTRTLCWPQHTRCLTSRLLRWAGHSPRAPSHPSQHQPRSQRVQRSRAGRGDPCVGGGVFTCSQRAAQACWGRWPGPALICARRFRAPHWRRLALRLRWWSRPVRAQQHPQQLLRYDSQLPLVGLTAYMLSQQCEGFCYFTELPLSASTHDAVQGRPQMAWHQ